MGRYTHPVAISNQRLLDIENGQVQFQCKDYRDNNQQKTMTLDADEFIRRFLLHTLPDGFQRIRYYGLLGNRYRQQNLARCRQLLGMASSESTIPKDYRDRYEELTGCSLRRCPVLSARLHGYHTGTPRPQIPVDPKHFMRMVTHATDQRPTSLALPTRKGNLVHNMPIHRSEDPLHWSPPIKMPEFSSVCHPTPRPDSVPWTSLAFLKDSANHSIPIGVSILPAV